MIMFVSGRPTDSETTILFTDDQLYDLADSVCGAMEYKMNVSVETCTEKFRGPVTTTPKRPTILCQTSTKLIFSIEPSKSYQLAALVPDMTEDSNVISDINYLILEPNQEQGVIRTTPKRSYTLWSTELKEGSPGVWQGGARVPDYDESKVPPQKGYTIKHLVPNVNGSRVLAKFTWNTNGECDIWFDVINSCDSIPTKSTKITLKHKGDEPQVDFDNLKVEDNCTVNVTGLYGSTVLQYRTPSCKTDNCEPPEVVPEIPVNIFIEANKETMDTWEVRANWARPHRLPDSYTVTLSTADANRTVVLQGVSVTVNILDIFIQASKETMDTWEVRASWAECTTKRRQTLRRQTEHRQDFTSTGLFADRTLRRQNSSPTGLISDAIYLR
ncbi:hypothetical protein PYW07_006009 [Mythimna separata]|uniref:Uncharacterized protein n=1 Tax=Mythimna separata TaxID=271217 RepID=A0AAD8DRH0_MYTSE|nr:hypothetical protein PYW07_006009 [Mythimna separata]